jgi:hypothetical protein
MSGSAIPGLLATPRAIGGAGTPEFTAALDVVEEAFFDLF